MIIIVFVANMTDLIVIIHIALRVGIPLSIAVAVGHAVGDDDGLIGRTQQVIPFQLPIIKTALMMMVVIAIVYLFCLSYYYECNYLYFT